MISRSQWPRRSDVAMVLRFASFLFALGIASSLSAQEANWNINFINPEFVVTTSEIGREITKRALERDAELRQMDAQTSSELNAREQELTALRDTMTMEEFTPLAEEFDQRSEYERNNLDQIVEQESLNRQAQFARLSERIRSEVIQFASERGLDAVFDSRQTLYHNADLDVSKLIVNRLDEDYRLNKEKIDSEIFAPVRVDSSLTAPGENGTVSIENQTEAPSIEQ